MKIRLKILSAALCLTAGLAGPAAADMVTGAAAALQGDTILVGAPGHADVTVRLWGVTGPAMDDPSGDGWFARATLDDLIAQGGRNVTCQIVSRGRPGQAAGLCSVGATDLGQAMIASGWAATNRAETRLSQPGVAFYADRAQKYDAAEAEARRARRGRWARMP